MDLKTTDLGEIVYRQEKGGPSLSVRGAHVAVDFTGGGLIDGMLGVNANIPLNTDVTIDVNGADVTLSTRDILKALRKLVKPIIRQEAMAQVTTNRTSMPSEVDD